MPRATKSRITPATPPPDGTAPERLAAAQDAAAQAGKTMPSVLDSGMHLADVERAYEAFDEAKITGGPAILCSASVASARTSARPASSGGGVPAPGA